MLTVLSCCGEGGCILRLVLRVSFPGKGEIALVALLSLLPGRFGLVCRSAAFRHALILFAAPSYGYLPGSWNVLRIPSILDVWSLTWEWIELFLYSSAALLLSILRGSGVAGRLLLLNQ